MQPEIINLPGFDPKVNLLEEERVFNELRATPRPVCLFYVNDPCVVLGRANREDEWVNLETLEKDGIPLLRRFSGGGTVYHDRFNLNFSLIVPITLLEERGGPPSSAPRTSRYIDWFRSLVIDALSRGGPGYAAAGVSDITLNGRKLSGNAQRISSTLVLHHGTIMRRCPLAEIVRYLRVPPNRPNVSHRGFVTGLEEEGRLHDEATLRSWLQDEYAQRINVAAEQRTSCEPT